MTTQNIAERTFTLTWENRKDLLMQYHCHIIPNYSFRQKTTEQKLGTHVIMNHLLTTPATAAATNQATIVGCAIVFQLVNTLLEFPSSTRNQLKEPEEVIKRHMFMLMLRLNKLLFRELLKLKQ